MIGLCSSLRLDIQGKDSPLWGQRSHRESCRKTSIDLETAGCRRCRPGQRKKYPMRIGWPLIGNQSTAISPCRGRPQSAQCCIRRTASKLSCGTVRDVGSSGRKLIARSCLLLVCPATTIRTHKEATPFARLKRSCTQRLSMPLLTAAQSTSSQCEASAKQWPRYPFESVMHIGHRYLSSRFDFTFQVPVHA